MIILYRRVERGEIEEGRGIRINVRNEDGDLVEKQVRTYKELQELVEESYPKTEQKEEKQQPGNECNNCHYKICKKLCLIHSCRTDDRYRDIRVTRNTNIFMITSNI